MANHNIVEFTQKLADTFTKQSNIADVESTTTASKAYAVGEHLIYNGQYYKVTTAITSGGMIVTSGANANVQATTVSEDISELTPKVYGVVWDGSADTSWTRTDDAASFADPNPYYAGMSGTPSSPFDNIQPWAGMVNGEDASAGTVVAIPKFYYKMGYASGTTGLKIQIAPASNGAAWAAANGYKVSPAHMDRGDGVGERDVVYVGRYHCVSDYKSTTGAAPKVNETRATYRSGIHALGSSIWQNDFALFWTIRMLYLVEFADWNSQAKIGGGCGNNSSIINNGNTDTMPYHTGTTANSIGAEVYGYTQYRNIENMWDNVFEMCDGIYFNGLSIYGILNPANFNDSTNGTYIGERVSKTSSANAYISKYRIPAVNNYDWFLYPSETNGSSSTFICDAQLNYNGTGATVLAIGGRYIPSPERGAFHLMDHFGNASAKRADTGSRLMVLP